MHSANARRPGHGAEHADDVRGRRGDNADLRGGREYGRRWTEFVDRWPWAVIQLPADQGGLFRLARSSDCVDLADFFGEGAKEAFDTGRLTVVDFFRSSEAAECFLGRFAPHGALALWDWYKKVAGLL